MSETLGTAAEACFAQGLEWHRQGALEQALAAYEQALSLQPGHPGALSHLGILAWQNGDLEAAERFLYASLDADGSAPSPWNTLGNVMKARGRTEAALACYQQALAIAPDYADAHFNAGNLLQLLGRLEPALASYARALEAQPDDVQSRNNRAAVLQQLGRWDEALDNLDAALALAPGYAEAHNNRGNVLARLRRHAEALASFERALACRSHYADAYVNRAKLLKDTGRLDAAQADLEQAIALDPGLAGAHWNLAILQLLRGDYAQGWRGYEWRWQTGQQQGPQRRKFSQPLWLGQQDLAGKTILLWSEQGLGDTLQFCRYAPLAAALGATVILEVQPALAQLLDGLAHQVLARDAALPAFDFHCPLMSLPLAFGTELPTVPGATSYLRADPRRSAEWRAALGPARGLRVGLAWSGNPDFHDDHKRSIAFAELSRALAPGCEFFSLQNSYREADLAAFTASQVADLSASLGDFADTAALCAAMDVVVSVDTSIAHLAGALGKQVWVLLPDTPDWRWMRERDDSPWYPGARLYRQQPGEGWEPVLARVRADLDALASTRGAGAPLGHTAN